MVPDFRPDGHLPPGRYSVTLDEAEQLLVEHPRFAHSASRRRLWDGLESYLYGFVALEDDHAEILNGMPLIHRLWLGGSFVSTKLDPDNVDASVLIDDQACALIKGQPGTRWLTKAFHREHTHAQFGVTALRIGYRPVASIFKADTLALKEVEYFRDRGIWDDWWQRCRLEGQEDAPPSTESAAPVRGYLEVTL